MFDVPVSDLSLVRSYPSLLLLLVGSKEEVLPAMSFSCRTSGTEKSFWVEIDALRSVYGSFFWPSCASLNTPWSGNPKSTFSSGFFVRSDVAAVGLPLPKFNSLTSSSAASFDSDCDRRASFAADTAAVRNSFVNVKCVTESARGNDGSYGFFGGVWIQNWWHQVSNFIISSYSICYLFRRFGCFLLFFIIGALVVVLWWCRCRRTGDRWCRLSWITRTSLYLYWKEKSSCWISSVTKISVSITNRNISSSNSGWIRFRAICRAR